jgi:hypothetical protein
MGKELSNTEAILKNWLGQGVQEDPPKSRIEKLLVQIRDEGGGGGGFTPTQAQLNAMNSGIDSVKVAQITTNTSDISDIQDTIGDINSVLEEVL